MEFSEFTPLQRKIIKTVADHPNVTPMEIKKLARVPAGADPTSKVRNAMRGPVNEGWIAPSAKGGYIVPGGKKKKITATAEPKAKAKPKKTPRTEKPAADETTTQT